ncbi:MAG: tRNA isopentenyl-2-thiomethyl-A-37 hydroxylase MiaE [Planctomycetota bacterium]|jgi:tRNA-(ms[2]io[6]A)-hydroxylase|nr:tRNA isopentenyl-2-thiomethyl-A-37 hydroxylase MiaE [Planctomycetota bacterium]MDP6761858.1 tRNA isopentenyl-2-thiomethyl-A-37 hydroxylase MiaE [Planctomycetota bacterium]MDP6988904.1 tRNA isopentenyl-2-thiomethyl-A-37 hydroxylase MiaE [Planctomycetota bacterium]
MIELAWRTPPAWATRVAEQPLALLSDHAHCELKAASTAQALIARHPDDALLVERLATMAEEEMQHFHAVVRLLHARGGTLGPLRPNPYAEALAQAAKEGRGDVLLDRLVLAGLIEARSLERFRLFEEHLADKELAALYRSLAPTEAAHQGMFFHLAHRRGGERVASERIEVLRRREGRIVEDLPFAHRVHSGLR